MAFTMAACSPEEPSVILPEAGIARSLATERAETITALRYELSFDIPERVAEAVNGRVIARFELGDPDRPLVFDFDPVSEGPRFDPIDAVTVNGVGAEFEQANGHIVIPPSALAAGANSVELVFRAGDTALHRNPGFLYTLFVPALAHTVFPVFDQPDLKARYRLDLTVPADWVAVSNGVEVSREPVGDRVRIRYSETEPIPTYLFAFAAGRFQTEEAERDGRTFRMFHRETDSAKVERNRDAVFDLHAAALNQLEAYTGIRYPFGKFDFVLIPAFEFGGMEHPGSIYYRDSGILLDQSATQGQELGRASLISHETAHMWFGDLVTMQWFNDVWMKEVFANFMAAKIVNPSFPDVNHDLLFLTGNYPAAYGVDRSSGTHPIRQELDNLNDAGSLYGAIIYQKAPIVMRQLERILGEDEFRAGIRSYLTDFQFGNATWLDLVQRLDERTPVDLAAWSRAWVEEPGRPLIETELEVDDDGRISSLILVQSDPLQGRSLQWTQQIEVLVGSPDGVQSVPVELTGQRTAVNEATSLDVDFVLPNGGGLAYGDIVLDEVSRRYLLDQFTELNDPLTRGAGWVALWEEMLDGRIAPGTMAALALEALAVEDTEQMVQLMLGGVRQIFWRFLSQSDRTQLAPVLEAALRSGVDRSASPSLKSAYFSTFYSVVTTDDGIGFLEQVWSREVPIAGLSLSESDETTMAEQLAVRSHPRALEILEEQLDRIENTDRRARFEFIRPALSSDTSERDAFFASLAAPTNRQREPWVLDGLRYLHHPLRAQSAEAQIRTGLEILGEIQDTGDIFFPRNWSGALLGGHNTPVAADIVQEFLAEQGPNYPIQLHRIILQAADLLFRSVEILESPLN
jgi:aminopeptidase N